MSLKRRVSSTCAKCASTAPTPNKRRGYRWLLVCVCALFVLPIVYEWQSWSSWIVNTSVGHSYFLFLIITYATASDLISISIRIQSDIWSNLILISIRFNPLRFWFRFDLIHSDFDFDSIAIPSELLILYALVGIVVIVIYVEVPLRRSRSSGRRENISGMTAIPEPIGNEHGLHRVLLRRLAVERSVNDGTYLLFLLSSSSNSSSSSSRMQH